MLTLEELKERLAKEFDEVTLMEILGVTSEDLLDAFEERILSKFEELHREVEKG